MQFKQVAYYVDDVRDAAFRHWKLFGSGPFFARDYPPLPVIYRGKQAVFSHSSATGQWGPIQVEMVQENGSEPSILTELYPKGSGRTGVHHMALFVDHLETGVVAFKQAGHEEAMRVALPSGFDVVFMDTLASLGHFVELYEPTPQLVALKNMVAEAAIRFDGRDPVREAQIDLDTLQMHVY